MLRCSRTCYCMGFSRGVCSQDLLQHVQHGLARSHEQHVDMTLAMCPVCACRVSRCRVSGRHQGVCSPNPLQHVLPELAKAAKVPVPCTCSARTCKVSRCSAVVDKDNLGVRRLNFARTLSTTDTPEESAFMLIALALVMASRQVHE